MNTPLPTAGHGLSRASLTGLWLAGALALGAAEPLLDWRLEQRVGVAQPGLLKVRLPAETLGAARAELEDLRVLDPQGRETPYAIERTQAGTPTRQAARSFSATLNPEATVLLVETGAAEPIDSLVLATPATDFVKALTVETSIDRAEWRELARGVPAFRQPGGAGQLRIPLPKGVHPWLRLTVDDRRTPKVPFTGATVWLTPAEPPTESRVVAVAERIETPNQTRLQLALPAAHLLVAAVELEVSDALFSRQITFAARRVSEGTVGETPVAQGTIFRLALEALGGVSNQVIRVEQRVPSREAVVIIDNQDSAPLTIGRVHLTWRPAHVVFQAREPGTYRFMVGNNLCPAPRYDVAALEPNLREVPVSALQPGPLTPNANYRPPAALPTVADTGASLDTAAWKYRSLVQLARAGVQQLDLNLGLLARARRDLGDLRLLRGTNQVPYVLEKDFALRTFEPVVQAAPDAQRPRTSRWRLTLPFARAPLARLACSSPTPLFERHLLLYEERADTRGERHRHPLGQATWRHTPGQPLRPLVIDLSDAPETDTLWLETDNGDNPMLQLERFEASHAASRLLFKCDETRDLWVYYGNPSAGAPRYDLGMVTDQLLAAEKSPGTLGAEQRLHRSSWRDPFGGERRGGPLIWGALLVVVAGLLVIVRRLLPQAS